jgi:hypothetical protein
VILGLIYSQMKGLVCFNFRFRKMLENSCNFREITLVGVSVNLHEDDLQYINRIINKYLII